MKIQQIDKFKPFAELEVSDTQVLSGEIPGYLQRSMETAMRQGRLRAFMRYTCAGLGNQLSLDNGRGLVVVEDADNLTLDADDEPDLSDLITDRALKPTKAAIATWIKTIKKQIDAWKNDGLTLTEIRDRIPTLYSSLGSDAFAKTLTQSMQVSYLGSRAEILDEILDEIAADGNAEEETF